ncbi:hypothetical protein KFK09_020624 [Dendrobium nobile]|uniref:Uncharacterized protein n=1 Tax=Dendrobium nobile TaxID=94219 RepID=A0A8T3AMS6_DENNO|nr:hypothetical protein KFK09_020624 [Dendrobium nobile]
MLTRQGKGRVSGIVDQLMFVRELGFAKGSEYWSRNYRGAEGIFKKMFGDLGLHSRLPIPIVCHFIVHMANRE